MRGAISPAAAADRESAKSAIGMPRRFSAPSAPPFAFESKDSKRAIAFGQRPPACCMQCARRAVFRPTSSSSSSAGNSFSRFSPFRVHSFRSIRSVRAEARARNYARQRQPPFLLLDAPPFGCWLQCLPPLARCNLNIGFPCGYLKCI